MFFALEFSRAHCPCDAFGLRSFADRVVSTNVAQFTKPVSSLDLDRLIPHNLR